MYILLTSKFVFNAKDYNEILRRNKQCKVYFPKKIWENLSYEAQQLCSLMLQKKPENRVSAAQALEHPWFKMNEERDINVPRLNMFAQNEQEDFNMNEEEKEEGVPENLMGDLVTSSPIMNKKKMLENMRGFDQEKDKLQTF